MALIKEASVDGKEHYRRIYEERMADEARWLAYGARYKVDSVQRLLERQGTRPHTLLELGAGSGAVIAECKRRALADEYLAVDYSESAVKYLRETLPGVDAQVADVTSPGFKLGRHADVIILSHVVEHLEEPAPFLAAVSRMDFDLCIVEVPLEDLAASRLKNRFRDRLANAAGHVQFFTPKSFDELVRSNGFEILDRRRYTPVVSIEALRFQRKLNGTSFVRFLQTIVTANIIPRILAPLWSRVYYAHYAVLCRKAASGAVSGSTTRTAVA